MEPQGQSAVVSNAIGLRAVTRTDTGLVRGNNEDTVVLGDLTTGEPAFSGCIGAAGVLFGICDGMGGEAAGEVASQIVAETVRKVMALAQLELDHEGFAKSLVIAIELGGKAVRDYVAEHPKCSGMGTTCTVGALRGSRLVVAHVGDSRAYLLRSGELKQLTRDHNLANEMLARGRITREQMSAVVHGKSITQAVGSSESLEVDLVHVDLVAGDRVLICSDGLSDMVEDASLAEVLAGELELEAQADALVGRAMSAGGRDNISLVLCEVRAEVAEAAEEAPTKAYPTAAPIEAGMAAAETTEDYRLPVSRRIFVAPLFGAVLLALGVGWWIASGDGRAESARSTPAARSTQEQRAAAEPVALPSPVAEPVEEAPAVAHTAVHAPIAPPVPMARSATVASRHESGRRQPAVKGPAGVPSAPAASLKVGADESVRPPEPSKRNPF